MCFHFSLVAKSEVARHYKMPLAYLKAMLAIISEIFSIFLVCLQVMYVPMIITVAP